MNSTAFTFQSLVDGKTMILLLLMMLCVPSVIPDISHDQPSESFTAKDVEEQHHHAKGDNQHGSTDDQSAGLHTAELSDSEDVVGDVVSDAVSSDKVQVDSATESGEAEASVKEATESILTSKNSQPVFSLTQFIKSWLNPVLQEFQEGLNVAKERSENAAKERNETEPPKVANISTVNVTSDKDVEEGRNATLDSGKKLKFNCTGRNITENTTAEVRLVNSSTLLEFLSFDKNNNSTDCVLIMFYAPWCQFCARAAAQFNAVGRAFKQLDILAVDAIHFSNLNARFGTVAVPNIMVFHRSRSALRFNQTDRSFNKLIEFVTNVTGLQANTSVEIEDMDYLGPLSSKPTVESDYLLWCAWIFVLMCTSHTFINSRYGQGAIEKVRTLWQEHQHIE